MGYFPLCVDLKGRTVLLAGSGPRIREKIGKLTPFGGVLRRVETLRREDLTPEVALVVAGDLPRAEAERISRLCASCRVPVNVVDEPDLCTVFFPALVTAGELTVSVSTGGACPGAAGYLADMIRRQLPSDTEQILDWLQAVRRTLRAALPRDRVPDALRRVTAEAFSRGRILSDAEVEALIR